MPNVNEVVTVLYSNAAPVSVTVVQSGAAAPVTWNVGDDAEAVEDALEGLAGVGNISGSGTVTETPAQAAVQTLTATAAGGGVTIGDGTHAADITPGDSAATIESAAQAFGGKWAAVEVTGDAPTATGGTAQVQTIALTAAAVDATLSGNSNTVALARSASNATAQSAIRDELGGPYANATVTGSRSLSGQQSEVQRLTASAVTGSATITATAPDGDGSTLEITPGMDAATVEAWTDTAYGAGAVDVSYTGDPPPSDYTNANSGQTTTWTTDWTDPLDAATLYDNNPATGVFLQGSSRQLTAEWASDTAVGKITISVQNGFPGFTAFDVFRWTGSTFVLDHQFTDIGLVEGSGATVPKDFEWTPGGSSGRTRWKLVPNADVEIRALTWYSVTAAEVSGEYTFTFGDSLANTDVAQIGVSGTGWSMSTPTPGSAGTWSGSLIVSLTLADGNAAAIGTGGASGWANSISTPYVAPTASGDVVFTFPIGVGTVPLMTVSGTGWTRATTTPYSAAKWNGTLLFEFIGALAATDVPGISLLTPVAGVTVTTTRQGGRSLNLIDGTGPITSPLPGGGVGSVMDYGQSCTVQRAEGGLLRIDTFYVKGVNPSMTLEYQHSDDGASFSTVLELDEITGTGSTDYSGAALAAGQTLKRYRRLYCSAIEGEGAAFAMVGSAFDVGAFVGAIED